MQAMNAVIGGEGSSGGIIFPAVHLCRDSYTGMAFLLDRMAETGQKISALAASAAALSPPQRQAKFRARTCWAN